MQNETIRINIDNRDVRNLNRVFSDLDRTLSDLNGTLSSSMQNVQSMTSALSPLENAAKFSSNAFKSMETGLKLTVAPMYMVNNHLEDLDTALLAAQVNAKAAGTAFTLKSAAAWTSVAAFTAMKLAMKALPFVGIASMALSLVSSLGRLFSSMNNIRDSIGDVIGSVNKSRDAHRNAVRDIDQNERANARLVDRLSILQGQESLNIQERQELARITDRLNDRIDGLNLSIDKTTGRLAENSLVLLGIITRHNDLALILERIKRYQELWFDTKDGYAELEYEIQNLIPQMRELEERLSAQHNPNEILGSQLQALTYQYNRARSAQAEFSNDMYELSSSMADYAEQWRITWKVLASNHELTFRDLNESQQNIVNEMVERWEFYTQRGQEMFSELGTTTKMWVDQYVEGTGYVRTALTETGVTSDEVLEQMIANMEANRIATQEWSNNLVYIAENGCAEFAEHLRNLGPEAAGYVQHMVDASGEQLERLIEEFHLSGVYARDNICNSLDEGHKYLLPILDEMIDSATDLMESRIADEFPKIGESIPAGMIQGARKGDPEAIAILEKIAEGWGTSVARILGINSPSRVFMGYGQNIIEGLNIGLLNNEGMVMSTAARIANNIAAKMRAALDINSPSRLMREQIGRQIPAGVAAGIDKYSDYALDSAYDLGKDLLKVDMPKMSDIIKFGPSLSYAGIGGYGGVVSNDYSRTNDNRGLFEGATINWHGKQDIRETMEEIAWEIQSQDARFI